MSTTCDDVLIPTNFSADAVGGPEFATAIIRSGEGGAIAHRNVNLEDFISKYEIEYGNLTKERKNNLRNFAILRQGQARAFLFLAPDDSELDNERLGKLYPGTGEVGYLTATDGVMTDFYAVRHYSDAFNNYIRRLCKLSPYEMLTVNFYNAPDSTLLDFVEFEADENAEIYYSAVTETKSLNISINRVVRTVTVYYRLGKVHITPALPAGLFLSLSGQYFLPVTFSEDWLKFSIDESTVGGFKISLAEVLPVELGIV